MLSKVKVAVMRSKVSGRVEDTVMLIGRVAEPLLSVTVIVPVIVPADPVAVPVIAPVEVLKDRPFAVRPAELSKLKTFVPTPPVAVGVKL